MNRNSPSTPSVYTDEFHDPVLEALSEGVVLVDSRFRVCRYNRQLLRLWSFPEGLSSVSTDFRAWLSWMVGQIDAGNGTGKSDLASWWSGSCSPVLLKNGRQLSVRMRSIPGEKEVSGWIMVCAEVVAGSETNVRSRDLEAQIARLQRFSSRSLSVFGVIHDLRNQICSLVLGAEHIRLIAPSSGPMRDVVEVVALSAMRAKRMVENVFEPAGEYSERSVCDLVGIAGNVVATLRHRAPPNVDLKSPPHHRPVLVKGNPDEIYRLVLNLVSNALQAVGGNRGKVDISVTSEPQVEALIPDGSPVVGPFAVVTVGDTGPGIPDSVKKRMFEPFFSTKPSGQGTGLGLAIVKQVMEAHGAFAQIESSPDQGTRIRIFFPEFNNLALQCADQPVQ
jgi:signal transduction histidine kinase